MMRNLLLLMALLCSVPAFSQTSVSGTVSNSGNGELLVGVNVVVKGTTVGTITDIDGNFTLTNSQALPWTVEVSYIGYETQTITVNSASDKVVVKLKEGSIVTDEVVISASRKREKVQEAPASVSVLTARKLEVSANATDPTRSLISTPGVQIQQQSANRINISMRGGAGLFGTSVFPIMDYRSLVGPGIGTFQTDNSGISNIDLQRIEVVRGPGSALYGPGVTQGVVHFMTKNPIDFPGTTVEFIGGTLSTYGANVRHAGRNESGKFGYKINARYQRGDEFTLDPNNPDDSIQIAKFRTTIVQPAITPEGYVDAFGTPRILLTMEDLDEDGDGNPMQADWFNTSVNATLEFRPKDNLSIFLSGGYNQASSVFYNEQGEGLAQASEIWTQARVQAGGLFAQVFFVDNDGGNEENPTFLYQTGNRSPVARTQLEAQLQYNFDVPSLLNSNWTAGFDYRFAGQNTENLVYGRNEDDDDYSVIGGYLQGKLRLADKLDMVVAGRYDRFNFIDDGAFAPRAALVYKASAAHTFRASYNQANSTVSNLQLNIDFPLATIAPQAIDIWLYGNKTPQTFGDNPINWFIPGIPDNTPGLPVAAAFAAVNGNVVDGISALLAADPSTESLVPIVQGVLNDPTLVGDFVSAGIVGELAGYNLFNGTPLAPVDAPISTIAVQDTWEVGYKGLVANKVGVTFDVYHITEKNNSQFTAISPAYSLENLGGLSSTLATAVENSSIATRLEAALLNIGMPAEQAAGIVAASMPNIAGAYALGGAGLAANFDTQIRAENGLPRTPVATTQTDQVPDDGLIHIAAGYRTFDKRSYWGADLGLEYYFDQDLSAFFNYSWVSDNSFMQNVIGVEDSGPLPSFLNIPENKFRLGLNYTPESGIRGNISFQHDDSYFADAGQFTGDTDARNLFDAAIGYKFENGLAIDLSGTNVLNNKFRYLPNMPEIGGRYLAKVTYTFK